MTKNSLPKTCSKYKYCTSRIDLHTSIKYANRKESKQVIFISQTTGAFFLQTLTYNNTYFHIYF